MGEVTKIATLLPEAHEPPALPSAPDKSIFDSLRKWYYSIVAASALAIPPATSHAEESVAPMTGSSAADRAPSAVDTTGSLFIAGGGKMSADVYQRFVELAGGQNAEYVFIPTATEKADRPKQEVSLYWEEVRQYWEGEQALSSVTFLHTRDRAVADTEEFVLPLRKARAVWIPGGNQSLLTTTYLGTRVQKELWEVLNRGGVIGGTSAGAAAVSGVMITGGNPKARYTRGFGFLPAAVIEQHIDTRNRGERFRGVLQSNPHCLGMGVCEGTVAIIRGTTVSVLGKGSVELRNPVSDKETEEIPLLNHGEHYEWKALKKKGAPKKDAPKTMAP